ncbi:TPA: hypothetical protein ACSP1Z_004302, partial [Aeromonas hydrophila]
AAWTNGLTSANNRGQPRTFSPEAKLSHWCDKWNPLGYMGKKMNLNTAARGTLTKRGTILY